ncbi:uncharacterized protein [Asterias amurensis]|uniref:uncharacterized protein n=1 Tax=Asterias amurensis TaxID=7602 RepID=UPI003AB623CE
MEETAMDHHHTIEQGTANTQQPSATGHIPSDLVTLNVGGSLYTTTVATLIRYPESMLGSMFGGNIPTNRDNNGHYTIDRDGPIFRHVLNFLRNPKLCLPSDFKELDLLSTEADFFQIKKLIDAVKLLKEERSAEGSRHKMEFVEISFARSWCEDRCNASVSYRGTEATLNDIPTLLLYFKNRDGKALVNDTGFAEAAHRHRVVGDRMKIYQEVAQLGFKVLNTNYVELENVQTDKILFGRNI